MGIVSEKVLRSRFPIVLGTYLILFFTTQDAQTADSVIFQGRASVIDGDTIAVGSRYVRLHGIDAPETDQVCLDARGERWTCGIAAREHLYSHIAGRAVTCTPHGEDRYGRTLATCSTGGENLNAWMVREGWALAYVQ